MADESGTRRDRRVSAFASAHHSVISAWKLRELEVGRDMVADRVAAGRLVPMWPELYCVGHEPLGVEPWIMGGALLAKGVACARSAAHLWGWRELANRDPIEVASIEHHRGRPAHPPSVPALKITRVVELPPWTRHDGIPVTSAARAVLDCCAVLPRDEARRLTNQALVMRHVSLASLARELDATAGRRGAGALRRILANARPTRSEAEDLLVALLDDHGIDGYLTNHRVEGVGELDAYFPSARLGVEVDSRFHDNPLARAGDEAKDARARAHGIEVIRLRWRQLTVDRPRTAGEIRAAAGPRARGPCAAGGC